MVGVFPPLLPRAGGGGLKMFWVRGRYINVYARVKSFIQIGYLILYSLVVFADNGHCGRNSRAP